jgi:hypothetical protein
MRDVYRGGLATHDSDVIADAFGCVSGVLWAEREALELLLFTLVQEQLILTSGSTRWLHRADAQVRAAVEQLRSGEVVRAAEVEALALAQRLPLETTLAELADSAPEPWPMVLTEHRTALRALVFEVESVASDNRRLLEAGEAAIRGTLDGLGLSVATYDASGGAARTARGPLLFDEQA